LCAKRADAGGRRKKKIGAACWRKKKKKGSERKRPRQAPHTTCVGTGQKTLFLMVEQKGRGWQKGVSAKAGHRDGRIGSKIVAGKGGRKTAVIIKEKMSCEMGEIFGICILTGGNTGRRKIQKKKKNDWPTREGRKISIGGRTTGKS